MSPLAISRVQKKSVEVKATEVLREAIVSGSIPEGERITEVSISKQMELSRATIRTALHELAKEGLLTLVPYTGWTVVNLTADDVWELFTLRSAVERLAAELLAKSIDASGEARLQSAFSGLVKACESQDKRQIAEADFALHKTIIELASHKRLLLQYELIEQQVRMCIRHSDDLITDTRDIIEQHRGIVDAILSRNVELSGKVSEAHNIEEGRNLQETLVNS